MCTIKNKKTNMCFVLNERYDQGFNTNEHYWYFRIDKHLGVLSMNMTLP